MSKGSHQVSMGPSEVADQSKARTRSAISPEPKMRREGDSGEVGDASVLDDAGRYTYVLGCKTQGCITVFEKRATRREFLGEFPSMAQTRLASLALMRGFYTGCYADSLLGCKSYLAGCLLGKCSFSLRAGVIDLFFREFFGAAAAA